ncbi:MAG: glycosyltransferase [Phycisphaerales bacterium]|nr:glycosyltransferase [Phycisphaerales bacterium]
MEQRTVLIIVNYRTAALTLQCLESVEPQRRTGRLGWRVVVLDNASPDGSGATLAAEVAARGWTGWVQVVLHPVNGGFGAGNNAALSPFLGRASPPEYFFLLNPDTIVLTGALDILIEFMDAHPDAAIAGAGLQFPDGRMQGSAHVGFGLVRNLVDGAHTGFVDRFARRWSRTLTASAGIHRCDWVSGAAMFLRREVLERVGLFDEGFFLYFDEVDLSRRAARSGFASWYVPESRIIHLEGQATGMKQDARPLPSYWFASRRRFFRKHYGTLGILAADALWLCGRSVREARAWLARDPVRRLDFRGGPRGFTRDMIAGDARWLLGLGGPRANWPAPPPRLAVTPMRTGVVVIGRNEGPRLEASLRAARAGGGPVVYVDSRSSDGSVERARSLGVPILGIPEGQPLSAARARNVGFAALLEADPALEVIQFIDGDCEMMDGWFQAAWNELAARPDAAIVFGRVRERDPDANIYTRLCDMEFDRPPGDAVACGGIFMVRAAVMKEAGGFNPDIVAAEEPELSKRIAGLGWKIVRLGRDMCLHDSGMTRFGQWWRREMRGGYAGIDAARRFGLTQYRRQNRSARMWTAGVIAGAAAAGGAAAWVWGSWAALAAVLIVLALVPFQSVRLAVRAARRGAPLSTAFAYGAMMMVSKWAQAYGQTKRSLELARGRSARIVEHRGPAATPAGGTP